MIALIGAKPVPEATNTIGLARILAQEEGAERALEAQDVALLHLAEHVVGELAAGDVAHVQLDQLVVVRRVAPWRSCAACRPSAGTRCTGRRGTAAARSPAASGAARSRRRRRAPSSARGTGSVLIWMSFAAPISRASITSVAERLRLAEERLALRLFLVGQRASSGRRRSRRCLRRSCPCSCRRRRSAAVGQHQALAQRRAREPFRPPRRRIRCPLGLG